MKTTIMKYAGVGCVVVGSALMYISGVSESSVTAVVAGVFVCAAAVKSIIDNKSED